MTDKNCRFCSIIASTPTLPVENLVWHFPHSVALLGEWQFFEGYCVLVSRTHARELFELDSVTRTNYFDEMTLLARAIHQAFQPVKLNYELLGNQVPHLHWHLFPRYDHDPGKRSPVWLAIDAAERDPRQRAALQAISANRSQLIVRLRDSLIQLGAKES